MQAIHLSTIHRRTRPTLHLMLLLLLLASFVLATPSLLLVSLAVLTVLLAVFPILPDSRFIDRVSRREGVCDTR
jgi:hypothetical protein